MASATSQLERVAAVVLRFMRGPILVLLSVYAIGITGMALMPGPIVDGSATQMTLFHAFYFFTYSATTTGFGEIPHAFSDEQRLWATVCLYMGVVAWLYAGGSIIRLVLHPELLRALAERRFARTVERITEPFFILCGFGDTGSLLARGLSDDLTPAAVLDSDTERIKALRLRNYRVTMPGLCADASVPQHLLDAGVQHSKCRAVVVLTGSDEVNLKIAVMTRSLNPNLAIICRDTDANHRELLDSVGGVTLVNPFEIFARQLDAAVHTPLLRAWEDWLVGDKTVNLEQPPRPPTGKWVLCGFGRMGRSLHYGMKAEDMTFSIIDTGDKPFADDSRQIRAHVDRKSLEKADYANAVGLVAGTDNDEENLRILLSARAFRSDGFLVVRQNHHENELAFNAADVNLIMQPSLVLARHVLLYFLTPHLGELLDHLHAEGVGRVAEAVARSRFRVNHERPVLWCEGLRRMQTTLPGCRAAMGKVRLQDLLRHPSNRERNLDATALIVKRGGKTFLLPAPEFEVKAADVVLFCGTRRARQLLNSSIQNPYTMHYLTTGEEAPRGWFFQWLCRRYGIGAAAQETQQTEPLGET